MAQHRQHAVLARFGSRVQQLRQDRGVSQDQLAVKLGVHRPYLSDIERGARNPSLVTIARIGKALGVDLSSLFRGV